MRRRSFLKTVGAIPALAAAPVVSTASRPPRKVVVGTVMQPFWVEHPGLSKRLVIVEAVNVSSSGMLTFADSIQAFFGSRLCQKRASGIGGIQTEIPLKCREVSQ